MMQSIDAQFCLKSHASVASLSGSPGNPQSRLFSSWQYEESWSLLLDYQGLWDGRESRKRVNGMKGKQGEKRAHISDSMKKMWGEGAGKWRLYLPSLLRWTKDSNMAQWKEKTGVRGDKGQALGPSTLKRMGPSTPMYDLLISRRWCNDRDLLLHPSCVQ